MCIVKYVSMMLHLNISMTETKVIWGKCMIIWTHLHL